VKLAAQIDFEALRSRSATVLKRSDDSKGDAWLKGKGYLAMSGQIIDASLIAALRQRNMDADKVDLKEGRIPRMRGRPSRKSSRKRLVTSTGG
jgi:hypothetical protein